MFDLTLLNHKSFPNAVTQKGSIFSSSRNRKVYQTVKINFAHKRVAIGKITPGNPASVNAVWLGVYRRRVTRYERANHSEGAIGKNHQCFGRALRIFYGLS